MSSGAGSAFGEIFSRNGSRPSEVWRRYQAGTSSVCGQDASITSPIDSVWRRVACRQVHTPKAMLAVPAPWPAVFFDGIVRRRARTSIALPLPPPNVRLTERRTIIPAVVGHSPESAGSNTPSRIHRAGRKCSDTLDRTEGRTTVRAHFKSGERASQPLGLVTTLGVLVVQSNCWRVLSRRHESRVRRRCSRSFARGADGLRGLLVCSTHARARILNR